MATIDGINAVAFAPDGKSVSGGASDSLIRIWKPATGKLLRTLEGHDREVTSLAFSPYGQCLASGSDDGIVRLWEPISGDLIEVHARHAAQFETHGFAFFSTPICAELFGVCWSSSVNRPHRHESR